MNKYLKFSLIGFLILFSVILINNIDFLSLENLENFIDSLGSSAIFVFFILYVVVTLFGFSAAVFTILAGTLFGVKEGLIIVVLAATVAATIAFSISRYFSKYLDEGKIKNKTMKNLIEKIEVQAKKNGFVAICILRLSFLPYIPLSYASGLVKNLKARDFILATFLTNIFGSFVFIFLGASLMESIPLFLLAIVLVLLFLQVPKLVKKYF